MPDLRWDTESSRLVGTAGCNRFSAPYRLAGGRIELGAIVTTLMACPDEPITEQEQRMTEALAAVERFELRPGPSPHLIAADKMLIRPHHRVN